LKKTITSTPTTAAWDPEALYLKAQRYVQRMDDHDSDDWEYALWSGFSLEFLARAALANISPALLADTNKNWHSLYHALGFAPNEAKFSARSIAISEVFKRLTSILPSFIEEHENFGVFHTGRRNLELHTGEAAFDGINSSVWQPRFYKTCEILLVSMGMTLKDFVGTDEEQVASQIMYAADDVSAKAVEGGIEAHKRVWGAKDDEERATLYTKASVWATRQIGHLLPCPACTSQGMVVGEPVAAPVPRLSNDEITETQEYLPNQFECVACGLKIAGLSRLTVAGLGHRYKKTNVYNAAEYYAPDDEYPHFESDNNEP
jgi:hypothetical protein